MTQARCTAWSSVCTATEDVCGNWVSRYFGSSCGYWKQVCTATRQVCQHWTQPVCNGWGFVCNNTVKVCNALPHPEPYCINDPSAKCN